MQRKLIISNVPPYWKVSFWEGELSCYWWGGGGDDVEVMVDQVLPVPATQTLVAVTSYVDKRVVRLIHPHFTDGNFRIVREVVVYGRSGQGGGARS